MTAAAASPAPAAPKTDKGTVYVVLSKAEGAANSAHWAIIDEVIASSANAAIRAVATDHVNGAAVYVAVPQRSWQPVKAKIDTKTVLTLENA